MVLLSYSVTRVLAYLSFITFSSEFTMCDMELESAIYVLLLLCLFDVFEINTLL